MQTTEIQSGIAIAQQTQADLDFYVPDGTLGAQKLSPSAVSSLTFYDAIVGPAGVYAPNVVQYNTIASALAAVPAGGTILILKGTYSEPSITISQEVHIWGLGRSTSITNPVIMAAGAIYSGIFALRFASNLTINSGCNGCFIRDCWQATGMTITNSGTANSLLIITE